MLLLLCFYYRAVIGPCPFSMWIALRLAQLYDFVCCHPHKVNISIVFLYVETTVYSVKTVWSQRTSKNAIRGLLG